MRKAKTAEEKEKYRPKMGKRIVSDVQARQMAGLEVEAESFLNDPTFIEQSMSDDSDYGRLPTKEEMWARHEQNCAERKAEFASIGRTGREVMGDLPPIPFTMEGRFNHDMSSESEPDVESDKENEGADEQREVEEKEKEVDETTPVAQQRSLGLAAPSSANNSAAAPFPSTPPARPDTGFKRPVLPAARAAPPPAAAAAAARGPPRHSTPKMSRPMHGRVSFGADISIIANTSLQAVGPRTERSDASTSNTALNTRKESTGSSRGAPTLHSHDEEEEGEEGQEEEAAANATYDVDRLAAGAADAETGGPRLDGTYDVMEEREEREEQAVQVHVESIVMRKSLSMRVRPAPGDVSTASMDEEAGGGGEEVAVVGIAMRRMSDRPPPQDATMMSVDDDDVEEEAGEDIDGGGRGEGDEEEEESQQMDDDDVEMASAPQTPVLPPPMRRAKRPSMEHPLDDTSSPMAVAMARRNSGLRDVKPKVSMAPSIATTTGRKVSTGSVASSIPFEDLSRSNLSVDTSDRSYEDPKTPDRTPRTTRLLRQSLAARDQRQSQLPQQRLPILEEAEVQGGGGSEDEDDEREEEDQMMMGMRGGGQRRATATPTTPTTPVTTPLRLPRLSQKLQSSVDRLSQPRHRHEGLVCSRMVSPARTNMHPGHHHPTTSTAVVPSPSPARRRFAPTLNQSTRGMMSGYTPNQRVVDTTLMEEDEGAKSGLAPRIKRIPRREQPNSRTATASMLLDVTDTTEEQSDIEEARRHQAAMKATMRNSFAVNGHGQSQSQDTSSISHAPTTTPVTSPLAQQHNHNHHDYDDFHEEREEEEEVEMVEVLEVVEQVQEEEGEAEAEDGEEEGGEEDDGEDDVFEPNHSMASSVGGRSAASAAGAADDSAVFVRPADPVLPATPRSAGTGAGGSRRSAVSMGSRRSMLSDADGNDDMDRLSSRASQISINSARRRDPAASFNGSFDQPRTPPTPFRALQARNRDLFSTDTPGIHSHRTNSYMSTTQEEEWAADQDSRQWRGDITTDSQENEGEYGEDSQLSPVDDDGEDDGEEKEVVNERVLAPRKLIAPTASPGVRRSTRTRMKPVRTWLGEQAQYEQSPTTGARRLVGVNEVVIRDKLYVKTGFADTQKAVEANRKSQKQRAIANKKRKEQKGRGGKGKYSLSDEESE